MKLLLFVAIIWMASLVYGDGMMGSPGGGMGGSGGGMVGGGSPMGMYFLT